MIGSRVTNGKDSGRERFGSDRMAKRLSLDCPLVVHGPRSSSRQEDVLDRPRIQSPMCPLLQNYHHLLWPSGPENRHRLILAIMSKYDRVMSSLKCQGK